MFDVRTSRTSGLSFVLEAPWEGNTGAVSNIVTRYRGHGIDSAVSRDAARHGTRAEGCWAGTTVDRIRLNFHVARVRGKTLPGHPTDIPLVYATHSMSSWKPMVKTFKGTIGNQDAFYCTKPPTTKVTFQTPGCAGCQISVMNGASRVENTWATAPKTVKKDSVTFRVPRSLTRGVTATVIAPWDGTLGYSTLVAFRYGGHAVGSSVSVPDARSSRHATPCWGGTRESAIDIPLTVHEVTTGGTTGSTTGSVAFAQVTQSWTPPMMRTAKGILGSQEVIVCTK